MVIIVGVFEGNSVLSKVGSFDGLNEGSLLGTKVEGKNDGETDGLADEGQEVIFVEGAADGFLVFGAFTGFTVGVELVGSADGTLLGKRVGLIVGR